MLQGDTNVGSGTLAYPIYGNHLRSPEASVMANRESAFIEITPEVLLKAYACGIFPMAESADDPPLYSLQPEGRRLIPPHPLHLSAPARPSPAAAAPPRLALAPYHPHTQPRPRRRVGGRRRAAGRPAAHLDQRAHPPALPQAARAAALPQPRGLPGRGAGRRPLRRHA